MSQGKFVILLLVVGSLGVWGCVQSAGNGANAERIRALETKIARLEDDFKASIAVREQLRKKLTSVEEERAQLSQQVGQPGLFEVAQHVEMNHRSRLHTALMSTISVLHLVSCIAVRVLGVDKT